ncbi:tetraspanin-9 isoform X1 [Copidosoma floridanum]|uniref:tetraspanin-9 isoform X1 n=1 Tax=Copidosoma floridanum TaxID=29053 RepID=UPI0006C96937|nr:tetraspanin-9 isoform X1 [Copidosoma floridanum]XP_014206335.1 tetraspanin-9 isoform X1 [Copidosoma floridanum]
MGRTGYTCIRHVFCSLNVLLWLCACGMLGAGLWMRFNYPYQYGTLVPQHTYASLDVLVLATGGITFVVAFFGCCGAWFQSRCLLITYFSLIILLFLAEFMLGALAFVFKDQIAANLKSELLQGITEHYTDRDVHETGTFANFWDTIQTNFHCCGVNKYYEWYNIKAWPGEERVPDSCCRVRERYCGKQYDNEDRQLNWWQEGCASAVQLWLVQGLHFVGTVGLVVGSVQLFGLIASMILFCTVRHKRSTHTYKTRRSLQQGGRDQALPVLDEGQLLRYW